MKKFLSLGVGLALAVTTSSFANGLTLAANGAPANILVYCNDIKAMFPIPKNGALPTLPWSLISGMFGATNLNCQFELDNATHKQIGTAHMVLTSSTGTISDVTHDDAYTIVHDKSWGAPHHLMMVTLQKNE